MVAEVAEVEDFTDPRQQHSAPAALTTAAARRDWALFLDWCLATERDPASLTTLDLLAFARDLPCKPTVLAGRLRAAVLGLGWVGTETGALHDAPAWRGPRAWVPLSEALQRCETRGWPVGYRGRRDAFILTLAAPRADGGLGLSRAAMRSLTATDLSLSPDGVAATVRGEHVRFGVEEATEECPSCAVVRWLDVLGTGHRFGDKAVRERLILARPSAAHVCTQPAGAIDEEWRRAWFLLPAMDLHGWRDLYGQMSTRSLTSVLVERCDRLAPFLESQRAAAEAPDDASAPEAHDSEESDGSAALGADRPWYDDEDGNPREKRVWDDGDDINFDEFDERLEAIGAQVDAIVARVSAAMDETDSLVAGLGKG